MVERQHKVTEDGVVVVAFVVDDGDNNEDELEVDTAYKDFEPLDVAHVAEDGEVEDLVGAVVHEPSAAEDDFEDEDDEGVASTLEEY